MTSAGITGGGHFLNVGHVFWVRIDSPAMAANISTRNQWGIPPALATAVIERDTVCIYCGVTFDRANRATAPSWEHIVNDESIITLENIALCCIGCNASKGVKPLADWLATPYCRQRGITAASIAPVARSHLAGPG